MQKEACLAVLSELLAACYSLAQSHYCSTRGLLPAAFPPWADSPLLRQPGTPYLRTEFHVDAELNVDA